jgi:hypothetical protein
VFVAPTLNQHVEDLARSLRLGVSRPLALRGRLRHSGCRQRCLLMGGEYRLVEIVDQRVKHPV